MDGQYIRIGSGYISPHYAATFLGHKPEKVMLLALGVFTLSNIISMLTSNFTLLLITRALPAFLHPVYVSMAFTVAAASVSKEKAPKGCSQSLHRSIRRHGIGCTGDQLHSE